ncbi:AAA family ATPase [Rhodobacter capsulatus]|uniref:AAA domain-containing protein n=1 Tax=Rhodobacter capsulatus TaxID=1061 RepID=A0A1G7MJW2_RHOCA|nr:AAA family ATPase [Rhodobacter capsulatus]WER08771.1 AAA family ATPase [Rhodobacter capsulatus]SDF62188.1 AAA domain-containing protein [Rhodobacter capsulatus]
MMRLRQLDLELFGGFSGQSFDFGAPRGDGEPDFHVIIGRNEAGKTTTMEGFLRLLYGFPHREPYDFLHQRKNLRVSGVLDIDGTEMAFTRLPNREPSLRDARGAEVPNSALQAHLGGLSEEDYRNLFCLDDATIERGGEEITRAKGDIGRLLFSAAAGISDLSEVLDRVRAEADGLYRKRASTTRLASLKKDHAEVERQIRELDISAAQYRKLKQAADEADAEEKRALEHRRGLFAAKAQLEARGKAVPLLGEIDALGARLVPFAAWPARLDIDPETLVRMSDVSIAACRASTLFTLRDS